ncbi:RagB/SusD family nutrient uptake outer membrane protein [Cesiribacter andamanensis]|uniref:SusD family protein n=1 Tax=Cesiribacter andamanensis AMV16 TaxID=1279009 RepID=M7N0A7_9BACT|nr:RagB/SusD family nutrient uptake outer membrane protein [Cesiribacter andamanensis]EMR00656.1 SusD family protein [Cesiribacter andamanensis AMV16]
MNTLFSFKYWPSLTAFLLLGLGLGLSSCEDFLEEDPQDRIAQSNFYATAQDAESAVNAIYAYLGSYSAGNTAGIYHSTFWITVGLASDEMINNQLGTLWNDELGTFSHNAENANALEIWQMHYKVIYLANIAIDRIPLINMDPTLRDRLVNEAKFLRGLMYFNLVRMYGRVPLLVSENSPLFPEAASPEAIYGQIIQDLTAAEALPPDGSIQEGRATRGAAKALLAKVYLTQGNFPLASAKALEVINSGTYALWEDFADVFKLSSRGGKEAIFSVGFGDADGAIIFWEVGQFNVRLLPAELSRHRAAVSNTHGWQVATPDLYNSFSDEDERKAVTFMTELVADNGNVIPLSRIHIQKFWDSVADPTAGGSYNDFPVIRYADVLLIYAEAKAEEGDFTTANLYLNRVRNRAGLADVEITGIAAFREAILEERRKEFVAEGHRWFDLVRMNKLEEKVQQAKGLPVDPAYYLFPIPQRERNVNPNLPQNTGY